MEKSHSLIIILPIVFLILLTIASGCTDTFNPRMFTTEYQYELQIGSNSTLHNATFIIPVPVKGGVPMIGDKTLTADDFRQPGISATLTQLPPGLDMTGVTSLQDYQPWFVVIQADEMTPINGSSDLYHINIKKYNNIDPVGMATFRFVPNPVGTESLIVPKFNFSWKDPDVAKIRKYVIRYQPGKVSQQTLIFTDYKTFPSTRVTVTSSCSRENQWREAYDDSYSNSYTDSFSAQFNGEKHGWYSVDGSIRSDNEVWAGYYPNLTNPEWQDILNQSKTT